jgi:uncharacterized membrane protein YoaK (UPF0700 family)
MSRDDIGHLFLAVILIAVAGYVDAIGLLKLGHLFVSFMSGDSTQLAVSASGSRWHEAGLAGSVVGIFVVGVMAGRLLEHVTRAWCRPVVLFAEALLLGLALLLEFSTPAMIGVIVFAMGVQNAALHRVHGAKTSLTYVTGTLVSFAQGLTDALWDPAAQSRWAWIPYLLLWIGLVLGAATAARTYSVLGIAALLGPILVLLLLAGIVAGLVARSATKAG